MIGWYIAGAVLLLLLALLFSRLRFKVTAGIGQPFSLKCSFWFVEIFRLPDEGEDGMTESKERKAAKRNSDLSSLKPRINTYDDILELLHTAKEILSRFRRLLRYVVIKNTELELSVVGDDAADTALKYGAVCSAVYPMLTLLAECFNFKPEKINISSGFAKRETEFSLKSDFSVRIIFLLTFAVSALYKYIKFKKEH